MGWTSKVLVFDKDPSRRTFPFLEALYLVEMENNPVLRAQQAFFFLMLIIVCGHDARCQGKMIYKGDTVNEFDASGDKHGKWVQTFPESKDIKFIGTFDRGTPSDTFRYYYRNGTLKALNVFGPDGERSFVRTYHKSGDLMAKGLYINQEKDSIWAFYDSEGALSALQEFEKGERDGQEVVFYRDGDTARIRHYEDSTLHGPWKKFFSNGRLEAKGHFEEGVKAGSIERYYPNGQLKFKGQHDHKGFRTKKWIWYKKSGNIKWYVHYEKGEVQKIMGPDGELIQKGEPIDTTKAGKGGKKQREGPRLKREPSRFEKKRPGRGGRGP